MLLFCCSCVTENLLDLKKNVNGFPLYHLFIDTCGLGSETAPGGIKVAQFHKKGEFVIFITCIASGLYAVIAILLLLLDGGRKKHKLKVKACLLRVLPILKRWILYFPDFSREWFQHISVPLLLCDFSQFLGFFFTHHL